MTTINDLQAGRAGEYMVCADLIVKVYTAVIAESVLAYDVIVDISGRLLRMQVKTTREAKAIPQRKQYVPAYRFNIRRMGKEGRGSYSPDDVDFFALVALDTKTIGYLHESQAKQTMDFRIREMQGRYFDEINQGRRAQIFELRAQGMAYREIAEKVGVDHAQVYRIVKGEGSRSEYRYLDELGFEEALKAHGIVGDLSG